MQEKALGVHADNPPSTAQDQTSPLLFDWDTMCCNGKRKGENASKWGSTSLTLAAILKGNEEKLPEPISVLLDFQINKFPFPSSFFFFFPPPLSISQLLFFQPPLTTYLNPSDSVQHKKSLFTTPGSSLLH